MKSATKLLLVLVAAVAAGACTSIAEKRKIDYKTTRTLPPLEVPPDLAAVPEVGQPAAAAPGKPATFSTFAQDRKTQPAGALPAAVLPAVPDMRMERDAQARWLVAQGTPQELWPRVREFVLANGLLIERENPEAGVLETDWAENRAKVGTAGQMLLAKWLGTLYSTGTRDRFRIRLERGAQSGTTEIYVAHRGMEEVVSEAGTGGTAAATRWQPRPPEPELEAEMLRLMIVYLGKTEEQAKAIVAQTPAAPAERARLARRGDGVLLSLDDSLDRAWRRVGLSLDRIGFTVEDRDRSKGVYYVRYIDPDQEQKKPGWFARMFGAEEKKGDERYEIHLQASTAGTDVAVKGKDGAAGSAKTGERILSLLYEQLK
jgi:outer membrane protein assembly factor BamC